MVSRLADEQAAVSMYALGVGRGVDRAELLKVGGGGRGGGWLVAGNVAWRVAGDCWWSALGLLVDGCS